MWPSCLSDQNSSPASAGRPLQPYRVVSLGVLVFFSFFSSQEVKNYWGTLFLKGNFLIFLGRWMGMVGLLVSQSKEMH